MASVISGKDMLLFFRKRADHATVDASKLRFQTEHSISMEKESESTQTKDGNVDYSFRRGKYCGYFIVSLSRR